MHVKKFPYLAPLLYYVYAKYIVPIKVLPSMRSLQFGGIAIEKNNTRMFNCSYRAIDNINAFSEAMYLLLGGTGLGISVQKQHIEWLPMLKGPRRESKPKLYVVEDSIMGWADAVRHVIHAYFRHKRAPRFDFSGIRAKGTLIKTAGGLAPGPEPLKIAIAHITSILDGALADRGRGCQLKPVEAYDMICFIAKAVLSGGIRRSAIITLFSPDDREMLYSKSGSWSIDNVQRSVSNNSAAMFRGGTSEDEFLRVWDVLSGGWGEPGLFWSNNLDWGANPCVEASLEAYTFCNLTSIVASNIESQDDLNKRAWAASFIGTIQASYTDFHYVGDEWQEKTEEDALIGVSMTGIGTGVVLQYDLKEAARYVKNTNKRIAKLIGINRAKRTTVIKPEGTASLVAGCSSGIHAYYDKYYLRRMEVQKSEPLYNYLMDQLKPLGFEHLLEDSKADPDNVAKLMMPIKAPDGAILRSESALDLLNRIDRFQSDWISEGHLEGDNKNNVSSTVEVKPDQWEAVGKWAWDHRDNYTGIAFLPYDGGGYVQAPHEKTDRETYELYESQWEQIEFDVTNIIEEKNNVVFEASSACSGGGCEVGSL